MEIWNNIKGKVAGAALAFLFGLGLFATYTGFTTAQCPDTLPAGSICLVPAPEATSE